jgi:hypothetical protein
MSKEPNAALVRRGHLQATTDPSVARYCWQRFPRGNIGLRLMWIWALDIDTRNGGHERLATWEAQYGKLPPTAVQETGSGGLHYMFQNVPAFDAISWGKLVAGIDIKGGARGYIVAAPSVHPETGAEYQWREGHELGRIPVAQPPAWLVRGIVDRKGPRLATAASVSSSSAEPSSQRVARGRVYSSHIDPAIAGQHGSDHTMKVIARVVHKARISNADEIFEVLQAWNARCQPPWSSDELKRKIDHVLNGKSRERRTA